MAQPKRIDEEGLRAIRDLVKGMPDGVTLEYDAETGSFKIKDGGITGSQIADGSLGKEKFESGALGSISPDDPVMQFGPGETTTIAFVGSSDLGFWSYKYQRFYWLSNPLGNFSNRESLVADCLYMYYDYENMLLYTFTLPIGSSYDRTVYISILDLVNGVTENKLFPIRLTIGHDYLDWSGHFRITEDNKIEILVSRGTSYVDGIEFFELNEDGIAESSSYTVSGDLFNTGNSLHLPNGGFITNFSLTYKTEDPYTRVFFHRFSYVNPDKVSTAITSDIELFRYSTSGVVHSSYDPITSDFCTPFSDKPNYVVFNLLIKAAKDSSSLPSSYKNRVIIIDTDTGKLVDELSLGSINDDSTSISVSLNESGDPITGTFPLFNSGTMDNRFRKSVEITDSKITMYDYEDINPIRDKIEYAADINSWISKIMNPPVTERSYERPVKWSSSSINVSSSPGHLFKFDGKYWNYGNNVLYSYENEAAYGMYSVGYEEPRVKSLPSNNVNRIIVDDKIITDITLPSSSETDGSNAFLRVSMIDNYIGDLKGDYVDFQL